LIASPVFLKVIEQKSQELGQYIATEYAEGFNVKGFFGVENIMSIL
jgi:hypothetical protein